ncbi:nitrate reductase subunit beta, partial [Bacillus velezensis]
GIVLVDQNACRSWRYCVSSCPYKKVYFNWQTNKAEKCTLCFPRLEAGLPTICSETCVGRIRYLGVMLYDADKVEEAASVENEKDLYHSQLDVFLDPNDPEIAKLAKEQGIPAEWIEAAQQSPIYKMIIDWKIALPLHPEYRTLPMVWYIPPLSPIMNLFEGKGSRQTAEAIFPAIDQMRIPIDYLAQLLTAGDTDHIRSTLKKMSVMRQYMRAVQTNKSIDPALVSSVGLTEQQIEHMYRLLAIAKYDDRFVIPSSHREEVSDLYAEQGSCGLSFSGGPGSCF